MNHLKIYNAIWQIARSENRIKLKKTDPDYVYYNNHHIVIRCMYGSDDPRNLVLLTAKEHYTCHKLLTYIYPHHRGIACAFHKMTFDKKGKHHISARDYAYARELIAIIPMSDETKEKIKKSNIGKNKGKLHMDKTKKKISDTLKGFKHTEETKQKQSKIMKGKNVGKKRSVEFKENLSKICKGRKLNLSLEQLKKRSEIRKGKKHSEETIEKQRLAHRGKKTSDETRKKQSESRKGKIAWNKDKIMSNEQLSSRKNIEKKECEYCHKIIAPCIYSRCHGNKCKMKI